MSAPVRRLRPEAARERIMVTPEGIALPLVLASRGSRFGALLLDFVMIGLLIIALTVTLISIAGGVASALKNAEMNSPVGHALQFLFVLWIVAMFLFRNAYFLFFELGPRGATPGKRILGIRVAARDGGRLSAEMIIARNLLRDIELFLPVVFVASAANDGNMGAAGIAGAAWFLVFALFICFNRDRLRAGDLIAGTWVVETPRRKLEAAMSASDTMRSAGRGNVYRFSDADLAFYGEYELQTLERVLREDRAEAMQQVAETICAKIGWNAPGPLASRAFLEAYYAQLRERLEGGMRFGRRKADKFG